MTRGTLWGTRALSLGMKREGRVLRHGWWSEDTTDLAAQLGPGLDC